jgi:hypothetical protein
MAEALVRLLGDLEAETLFMRDAYPGRYFISTKWGGVNTKIWYRRESDLWAQLGKKSRPEKEGFFKRIRQRNLRSAVCFRSAKGLFALISWDRMVTWPERKGRMDG